MDERYSDDCYDRKNRELNWPAVALISLGFLLLTWILEFLKSLPVIDPSLFSRPILGQ